MWLSDSHSGDILNECHRVERIACCPREIREYLPRIYARRSQRVDHIFPRFFMMSSLTVQWIAAIAFLLFLSMICVHHNDLETTDGATCLSLFIGRMVKSDHESFGTEESSGRSFSLLIILLSIIST